MSRDIASWIGDAYHIEGNVRPDGTVDDLYVCDMDCWEWMQRLEAYAHGLPGTNSNWLRSRLKDPEELGLGEDVIRAMGEVLVIRHQENAA